VNLGALPFHWSNKAALGLLPVFLSVYFHIFIYCIQKFVYFTRSLCLGISLYSALPVLRVCSLIRPQRGSLSPELPSPNLQLIILGQTNPRQEAVNTLLMPGTIMTIVFHVVCGWEKAIGGDFPVSLPSTTVHYVPFGLMRSGISTYLLL